MRWLMPLNTSRVRADLRPWVSNAAERHSAPGGRWRDRRVYLCVGISDRRNSGCVSRMKKRAAIARYAGAVLGGVPVGGSILQELTTDAMEGL